MRGSVRTGTLNDGRVVETSEEEDAAVLALGKVGQLLLAPVEPLVVTLAGDDAALGGAEGGPHAHAVDEVVCAGVGGAERLVFDGAPVGDEAPLHGVEDGSI